MKPLVLNQFTKLFPNADNEIITLATSVVTMTTQSRNGFTTTHHGFLADITLNQCLLKLRDKDWRKWECPTECVWKTAVTSHKIPQSFRLEVSWDTCSGMPWSLNLSSSEEYSLFIFNLLIIFVFISKPLWIFRKLQKFVSAKE